MEVRVFSVAPLLIKGFRNMFRKKWFLFVCVISVMAFFAVYYAVWYVPVKIKITELDLKSKNYPSGYPLLRIVAVSDVYAGSMHVTEQKLEELVAHVNLMKPDIVLLLGNYINSWSVLGHYIAPNRISDILTRINASYGVFAVFGKDDIFHGNRVSETAFRQNNIKTLSDKTVSVAIGNKKNILLTGIDSSKDVPETDALAKAIAKEKKAPRIIIANDAKDILALDKSVLENSVIALSGRTLGGQIVIPGMKPLFLDKDTKEIYGKYSLGDNGVLYVTSGIGTKKYPIRVNTEPEIVSVTLYPAPAKE